MALYTPPRLERFGRKAASTASTNRAADHDVFRSCSIMRMTFPIPAQLCLSLPCPNIYLYCTAQPSAVITTVDGPLSRAHRRYALSRSRPLPPVATSLTIASETVTTTSHSPAADRWASYRSPARRRPWTSPSALLPLKTATTPTARMKGRTWNRFHAL